MPADPQYQSQYVCHHLMQGIDGASMIYVEITFVIYADPLL